MSKKSTPEKPLSAKHPIAVVGAGGYVGAELCQLLARHPHIAGLQLFYSQKNTARFDTLHPHLRGVIEQDIHPFQHAAVEADIVFLATPHEVSLELTPSLLAAGKTVFDLSGALRLKNPTLATAYYGLEPSQTALLPDAIYGVSQFTTHAIRGARCISVPGCYPTAATLALKPLCDAGVFENNNALIINAVSGVSGAGKNPQAHTIFGEVSLTPYGIHNHRHTPEIEQNIQHEVVFTPHLGAYFRGILASCYGNLKTGITAQHIHDIYTKTYTGFSGIRLLPDKQWPAIKNVAGTVFADINFSLDPRAPRLSVFCAIDNLLKGAASHAIELFNLNQGYPIYIGLLENKS